jgi:hypothetical protein
MTFDELEKRAVRLFEKAKREVMFSSDITPDDCMKMIASLAEIVVALLHDRKTRVDGVG